MTAFRRLFLICLASGGWAFSFGVGTQVVTHWLNARGANNFLIGLNNSAYYLGIALASLLVPRLTRQFGNGCAAAGMILSGACLALFPWGSGIAWWFGIRFLIGVAGAISLVPLETVVSRDSDRNQRARNFSFYAVALTLGGAVGICSGLHFYELSPELAFFVGGIVPILSGLLVQFGIRGKDSPAEETAGGPIAWSRNFLSYGTAWTQGFLEGGLITFLSLHLVSLGMSKDAAGVLMGVTMVGVILFQIPVGWLADRLGRMPMLLTCYAMVALGLAILPLLELTWALSVCLFLFGAWSGAMYPLGLALLGDRMPEANLPRAYAWYMAIECVGSQLGAAAMGKARDTWGGASMFLVGLAAVAGIMAGWMLLWIVQRFAYSRGQSASEEPSDRRAA